MVSEEYDDYVLYVQSISDEELAMESEDTFAQINDEDASIQYSVCVEEQHRRRRVLHGRH